jgi:transcription elongation factor GreA
MRLKAYKQLENDLNYLRNVRLSEVAERLREARSEGGDLSENIELGEAMREHAHVTAQIEQIQQRLSRAVIINEDIPSDGTVRLNSRVTVKETGFEPETYHIVGSVEADPARGKISAESPLGKQLMGKQKGDTAEVKSPDGAYTVTIVKVE